MTDSQYACLRAAVNIARYDQVRRLDTIRGMLLADGFTPEDIEIAIKTWATYASEHN